MKLSLEEVRHIATLARVGMTEEEMEQLRGQLSDILEHFEVLKQVDTTDVPPTSHPITMGNVLREDQASPSFTREEIMSNAPQEEEGHFKVKLILG
ncbi:MAG: Asp-tRNA(Asn)/Glu-tRNA(Gln) amidotransferase subunit GatC [Dehalococcoidia bacterium]